MKLSGLLLEVSGVIGSIKSSTLILEVSGAVGKFQYEGGTRPGADRFVLILGRYMGSKKNKGKQIPTGAKLAGIDLHGAYLGAVSTRGHDKGKQKYYPGFGKDGFTALRENLPALLGYIPNEEMEEKSEDSAKAIKDIQDKYGAEGVAKFKEILADPEKWRNKEVELDNITADVIKKIEGLTTLNLKQRPLKSTSITDGRYTMGRYTIDNGYINKIFEHHYRTFNIGNIKGFSLDTLSALEKPEQKEALLEATIQQLDQIEPELKKEPTVEPPPGWKPEEEDVPIEEPGEKIATPEKPEYGKPPEEPEPAPMEIGIEEPKPESPILKQEPILKRKPSAEPSELKPLKPSIVEPKRDQAYKDRIAAMAMKQLAGRALPKTLAEPDTSGTSGTSALELLDLIQFPDESQPPDSGIDSGSESSESSESSILKQKKKTETPKTATPKTPKTATPKILKQTKKRINL
jgi:hypothetical protein